MSNLDGFYFLEKKQTVVAGHNEVRKNVSKPLRRVGRGLGKIG
jgi:hypothetical protein